MKRYAVVLEGQKPTSFEVYDDKFLLESNPECSIFIEEKKTEYGMHKMVVLHSKTPLTPEPIKYSLRYGDYYLFIFPKIVDDGKFKLFRDFLLSAYPQAKAVNYYPAPGYFYEGEKVAEPDKFEVINKDAFEKFTLYYHRYKEVQKDIFKHNFLLAHDIDVLEGIAKFTPVKEIFPFFKRYKSELYYEASIDRVVNNEGAEPY